MNKLKTFIKSIGILRISLLVICLLAVIGLFLPYEKSIGDRREFLISNPDDYYLKEVDYRNKDVVDISIIENFKVYKYVMNNIKDDDWYHDEATINYVITIVLVVSIVLITLFVLLKKYKLVILFDIIMAISSLLMNADIVSRHVIPSDTYSYGISYYLFTILAIIIIILSVASIIKRRKEGKKSNMEKGKIINSKKDNKDNTSIKINKNTVIIVSAIIIVLLIAVIVFLLARTPKEKNTSNNGSSNNNNSNVSSIINNQVDLTDIKGSSFDELKENLKNEEKQIVDQLKSDFEALKKETDTVEKYKANKDTVKAFYKKIEEQTDLFCRRAKEYTVKYVELIISSGKSSHDMYNDVDNIIDDIYNGVLDKYMDHTYNGLIDDMRDYYYNDILDDSDNYSNYSDYSDTISDEYKMNSNCSSNVYKKISNTSSDIYKLYSNISSDLYRDKLSDAQEDLDEFKENIK